MPALSKAEILAALETLDSEVFNKDLEVEWQSDRPALKLVPCRECNRTLVVTTFFAPAKAICRSCSGTEDGGDKHATVGQPIPGQTDPAKAVNLVDTLVNKPFAQALCPAHPNDPEHEMLLVSVAHNEHYGPSEFIGYGSGKPQYRQTDRGETVTHQCQHCKAVVTYSTTRQQFLKPINAPKEDADLGKRPGFVLETLLGTRDEPAAA